MAIVTANESASAAAIGCESGEKKGQRQRQRQRRLPVLTATLLLPLSMLPQQL